MSRARLCQLFSTLRSLIQSRFYVFFYGLINPLQRVKIPSKGLLCDFVAEVFEPRSLVFPPKPESMPSTKFLIINFDLRHNLNTLSDTLGNVFIDACRERMHVANVCLALHLRIRIIPHHGDKQLILSEHI